MEPPNYRKQIEDAVAPHWRGGGQARLIVDVLEREGTTPEIARIVGAKLASDVSRGLRFITQQVVEEKIEIAEAARSASGTTPVERGFDSSRCNFDDKPCRECAYWESMNGGWVDNDGNPPTPVIHGALVMKVTT